MHHLEAFGFEGVEAEEVEDFGEAFGAVDEAEFAAVGEGATGGLYDGFEGAFDFVAGDGKGAVWVFDSCARFFIWRIATDYIGDQSAGSEALIENCDFIYQVI